MITLINPPGLKTFSGLQMHVPNPPLGLAYIAAALKDAGFRYHVVDGTGDTRLWVRGGSGSGRLLFGTRLRLHDLIAGTWVRRRGG